MPLTDEHKMKLADIIERMEAAKEPEENIRMVASSYQQKYGAPATSEPTTTSPSSGTNVMSQFWRNTVSSGANVVGNVLNAVVHPVNTVQAIDNTIGGLANEYLPTYATSMDKTPETISQQNAYADAFKKNIVDRYGSLEKIGHTLYNDPVGTLADLSTLADGAGLALKGVSVASNAAKAGDVARLAAKGADVAKTAAAVTNPVNLGLASGKAVLDSVGERMAPRFYQSALKPSIALKPEEVETLVQTGLDNNIPVTKTGMGKLQGLIDNLNTSVKNLINSDPRPQIDPNAVANRVDQIKPKFANQVNPEADVAALEASKQEFLRNQPNNLTPSQAQELKQNTYKQLKNRAFGELKGAQVEAQKALARGLKEELQGVFPELEGLNAKQGSLIDLEEPLEKAVRRINNRELMGIGGPIAAEAASSVVGGNAGAVVGILKMVMDQPGIKSRLAIALNKAAKAKGIALAPGSVSSRITSYVNALNEAQGRIVNQKQDDDQQ